MAERQSHRYPETRLWRVERRRQLEGKVQEGGTSFCRAADERRSAKRDEGSGKTEGVSPGAICARAEGQSGPGRVRGQGWEMLGSFLSGWLLLLGGFDPRGFRFAGSVGLGFDGLRLLGRECLLGFGQQAGFAP